MKVNEERRANEANKALVLFSIIEVFESFLDMSKCTQTERERQTRSVWSYCEPKSRVYVRVYMKGEWAREGSCVDLRKNWDDDGFWQTTDGWRLTGLSTIVPSLRDKKRSTRKHLVPLSVFGTRFGPPLSLGSVEYTYSVPWSFYLDISTVAPTSGSRC